MSNYTETISAEVMIMNNDIDTGMSGTSIDSPEGDRPSSFTTHWKYPGGIIDKGWPTDNSAVLSLELVEGVMADTTLSLDGKRYKINGMVYDYGTYKLATDFDAFRDHYGLGACVTIP